jgi:hypothetical protein
MSEPVVNFETAKRAHTDRELAQAYREKIAIALIPVAEILNDARRVGLEVVFQFGRDNMGNYIVMPATVSRPL